MVQVKMSFLSSIIRFMQIVTEKGLKKFVAYIKKQGLDPRKIGNKKVYFVDSIHSGKGISFLATLLRKMYKEGLLQTTLENSEVQIGLMDVAKTSKKDLQFHFSNKVAEDTFFSLMIDF